MEPDLPNQRLNKTLALRLGVSRREADDLIASGRVAVNGSAAVLGLRITDGDQLSLDGRRLKGDAPAYAYLMLNKPAGYVSSRRQQGASPTVYALLPEKYRTLKPVGRLDRDSSGLLLFTNDGDFAQSMTHPSFYKTKRYEVTLDHPLEPLHQQIISDYGVSLPDGPSKFTVSRLDDGYEVIMHEGRNRQIRRTFAALGYTVARLHRTDFGAYALETLADGSFEEVVKR